MIGGQDVSPLSAAFAAKRQSARGRSRVRRRWSTEHVSVWQFAPKLTAIVAAFGACRVSFLQRQDRCALCGTTAKGLPMWTAENRRAYERSGLRYPSDLMDAEWALVEPRIP